MLLLDAYEFMRHAVRVVGVSVVEVLGPELSVDQGCRQVLTAQWAAAAPPSPEWGPPRLR